MRSERERAKNGGASERERAKYKGGSERERSKTGQYKERERARAGASASELRSRAKASESERERTLKGAGARASDEKNRFARESLASEKIDSLASEPRSRARASGIERSHIPGPVLNTEVGPEVHYFNSSDSIRSASRVFTERGLSGNHVFLN